MVHIARSMNFDSVSAYLQAKKEDAQLKQHQAEAMNGQSNKKKKKRSRSRKRDRPTTTDDSDAKRPKRQATRKAVNYGAYLNDEEEEDEEVTKDDDEEGEYEVEAILQKRCGQGNLCLGNLTCTSIV